MLQRSWIRPMIAALGISACSSSTEPAAPLVACTGPVTARVESAGDEATFTWTPRCGLYMITVIPPPTAGGTLEMWRLTSDAQLIGPGVRYGEQPPGTRTDFPALAVTRGKGYAVHFIGERFKPSVATILWTP